MKICAVQAVISMTLCSMAVAHNNYGQVLDKKITLSLKEVSIEEALDAIESATDVKFFYSVDQLNVKDKISFEVSDRSLRDLLDEILDPYNIKYKVYEKKATITLKKIRNETGPEPNVGDKEHPDTAQIPSAVTITGRVTDATTQLPMAGVNILIKGTANGTSSDAEGRYTINPETSDILVFSFIGYKTVEESVNGRTMIEVIMQQDAATLGEVVVNAGYWDVKERERTGNISRVSSADLQRQPVSNPLQALMGRMPGVVVTQRTGVPGGNIKIQVRGRNSIAGGNDPLYVIDGVPFPSTHFGAGALGYGITAESSPLNAINPSDIESIEILKDGDATAIYGSRGANGVVLITTKKGKEGRGIVDINFYTGAGRVSRRMDLLNTGQYLQMRREAFANDGATMTNSNARELLLWDTTRYTNWQKELFGGTSRTTNVQVSLSGGNANTQFTIRNGFYRETTVMPGDFQYQKGSGHMNINHSSINKKFLGMVSISYISDRNNLCKWDPVTDAFSAAPNAPPVYDEAGNFNWGPSGGAFLNPIAALTRKYQSGIDNFIGNMLLSYEILPGLKVKSSVGYTAIHSNDSEQEPLSSFHPLLFEQAKSLVGNTSIKTWIAEPQIEYQIPFTNSKLQVLIGSTFQQNTRESEYIRAVGFNSDALLGNISAASTVSAFNDYSQYRYNAVFGRINYSWNEKYIINLTGRRDGSSRFGPGKQFANFGAVGAAWIFYKKDLTDALFLFSFGKLRASFGTTGNDQIGDYKYLDSYTTTSYPYQGSAGLYPSQLYNPDYSWERNRKFETGIELGFVHDRIILEASYFRNRSSSQLVGYPLAPTTGFTSIQSNFPATVENNGIELTLNTTFGNSNSITWTTAVNLTIPDNKLIDYPDIQNSPYSNTYLIGESLNIIKTYQYTGVDPNTGLFTYKDFDENGQITNPNDRVLFEATDPDFYGGIDNSIQYKRWRVDFLFQFVKQNGYGYLAWFSTPGQRFSNQPVEVMDRWQKVGDATNHQRFSQDFGPVYNEWLNATSSDNNFVDASFVRLKNVSLSYEFDLDILKKAKIERGRAFLLGQNLLTITNYKGLDPENQSSDIPPLSVLTVGIQFTF